MIQSISASTKNNIGLPKENANEIAFKLNELLANYQIFYVNARGFHWNIKGENFFELHAKFEELYNNLQIKIDEIAERILTLGSTPIHQFSEYLKIAKLEEKSNISDGRTAINHIISAFAILLTKQRNLLELSGEINDEGTNSLMSDYIKEQEKTVWMYSSFLN